MPKKNLQRSAFLLAVGSALACFAIVMSCTPKNGPLEITKIDDLSAPANSRNPKAAKSPDILVVGDSQISYGAGQVHLSFFENLETRCKPNAKQRQQIAGLTGSNVGAIGVRSSSLHSWVLSEKKNKAMICDVDEKFGVNAGVYGIANNKTRKYVQIGHGPNFQFCKSGRSPMQAMFGGKYYDPKLFVMAFLGNSTKRWLGNPEMAVRDAQMAMAQIPSGMPCLFMTTAPSYRREFNDQRLAAQTHIEEAFHKIGSRCSFVRGITPQTRLASEGNAEFFTTNASGQVVDPHHPNVKAAERFFQIKNSDLCRAVFQQF